LAWRSNGAKKTISAPPDLMGRKIKLETAGDGAAGFSAWFG
jgi:hypothetical protein